VGLSETGATGPTGNRYGDAAGHARMAVAGPVERVITLETRSDDREANMWASRPRRAGAVRGRVAFGAGSLVPGRLPAATQYRPPAEIDEFKDAPLGVATITS
jgi:hypothetical protein